MEILEIEQGSPEWIEARLGMVTSSHFKDVLNKKSGRLLYMRKVVGERLSGIKEESYSNANMAAGIDLEEYARSFYEKIYNCEVRQVGFVKMNDWVGSSPDGLVGDKGGVEIKSVIPSTHINNIILAKMQPCYNPQVQGQLLVCEREWIDWISFCPAVKKRPFFSVRVYRDEPYIKELAIQVTIFVAELKEMIDKLTKSEY